MTAHASRAQLDALRAVDTPTLSNAIELLELRHPTEGYTGRDVRCFTPELGPMVGYAVTATIDNSNPTRRTDAQGVEALYRALADAPTPAVVVIQDVSARPTHSCHFGDNVSAICKRLGAVGMVSDGGFRDLEGIRRVGMQVFAAGLVASRGIYQWVDVNVPVHIEGLRIKPGDLLHGDANGLISIPEAALGGLDAAVRAVRDKESGRMAYAESDDFSLEGLLERLR